jgi:hypothetical protein
MQRLQDCQLHDFYRYYRPSPADGALHGLDVDLARLRVDFHVLDPDVHQGRGLVEGRVRRHGHHLVVDVMFTIFSDFRQYPAKIGVFSKPML